MHEGRTMIDDTESAVAAWLDAKETKREIKVAHKRLLAMQSTLDPILLAMLVEILAALNVYGSPDPEPGDPEDLLLDDGEDDEPWKR